MKKLFLILFVLCSSMLMAQTNNGIVSFVADTTTNAETEYLVLSSPTPITKNYALSLTAVSNNESGTATVTSMPQGSFDNTTFFDLQSSADTINNAGTAVNKIYEYSNTHWRYYRIKLVSTGTGVTSFSGKLGIKSHNYGSGN